MRPLAFIDIETTGLDPALHEIIEVAVILVRADTLEPLDSVELPVHPEHIDRADPEALRLNGYTPEKWLFAVSLCEALERITPLLNGAMPAGHNVRFDLAFLEAACKATGVTPPEMDHHLLDTAVLAWPLLQNGVVESLSLEDLCDHLEIPRVMKHQAYWDVLSSLEVARWLLPSVGLMTRVSALAAEERAIVEAVMARIEADREGKGTWSLDDDLADLDEDAPVLEKIVNELVYCAAKLLRERKERRLEAVGEASDRLRLVPDREMH